MTKLIGKIITTFFNIWYKIRPPEMVRYWKTKDVARAKVVRDGFGPRKMQIEGEKYPLPNVPRGHLLMGSLSQLKKKVKDMVFNQAFAEIEKMADANWADIPPPDQMSPPVRHIWETLELLENMEVSDDMRGRIRLVKRVLCFFLNEDDAYKFRAQAFLELIDQKKIKLSKEDKYFARGKYWKPDRYTKIFGKVVDKYEY